MLDNITTLLNAILDAIKYWIDSGLMEDTVVSLVNICKYSAAVLVPLFWKYYFALKGEG